MEESSNYKENLQESDVICNTIITHNSDISHANDDISSHSIENENSMTRIEKSSTSSEIRVNTSSDPAPLRILKQLQKD